MNNLKNKEVKHSKTYTEESVIEFKKDSQIIKKEKEMNKIYFCLVSQAQYYFAYKKSGYYKTNY